MQIPKLLVPAAILSASGFGVDTMINTLPQIWPDAPALVWYGLFVFGAILGLALPGWVLVTLGTYIAGKIRGRRTPTATTSARPANIEDWRKVDPYHVWQAGCLWGGVKPTYPVTFDNPAYWAFSMLLRAVEHGQVKPVKRVKKAELAFAQVSQQNLRQFAEEKGDRPSFLFGTSTDEPLQTPSLWWRYAGVTLGIISATAVAWNVVDFKRQVMGCAPKVEWLSEIDRGDYPPLNVKYEIRFASVVPQSPNPYWMSVEADAPGNNLKGLAIVHGDMVSDKARKPWQLEPQGIGARTYYPTGKVGFLIVAAQPDLVKLTPPIFECQR